MWQRISITAAILVLILSRVVHSLWTIERDQPELLKSASARLDGLPMNLGPWRGQALQLDATLVAQARIAGYISRNYQNTVTGDTVTILLVCGRPGPVSVHTPDACYGGVGYELVEDPIPRRVAFPPPGKPGEFFMARFQKPETPVPRCLRIYWAWNAKGTWEVCNQPRLTFAGAPALYKLYVIAEEKPVEGKPTCDPCQEFVDEWLPELVKPLTP
jgi:hypothetical protein